MTVLPQRRLAAILAADIVGYSRLVEADEAGTLAAVRNLWRDVVTPLLHEHHGRMVKSMGDGAIVEFASVVDAVNCAATMQQAIATRQAQLVPDRRLVYRIGINLGDVVVEGEDLLGDGVIVAARLEQLCDPGSVLVSGPAYDQLQGKIGHAIEFVGEQQVKNIARAVRVYRLRPGAGESDQRPALALPDRPSIAVLPFTNIGADTEQDYFADGMVEEVITALSRIRWLFVIARNSSFTYRGRAVDVKQVGRELGVRYVLEGSVRKAGSRVRIAGQLIDAATGRQLWADRFEGGLADVFDLQDQVTASVVGAVAPRLERAEIERAQRKPTGSLDAYDHFLRGMAGIHGWTREANAAAFACFTRAIALDPNFAAAYAMAARCFSQRKASGWVEDRGKDIAEAGRLARQAAELGVDDAIALGGAAMVQSYVIGDLDTAEGLIDRALILDPNYAWGWLVSCWIKGWAGEPEVAIEHAARAMRLSPTDPHTFTMRTATASAHFVAARYDAALAWAEQVAWERPGFLIAAIVVAAAAALAGRAETAERAMGRLRQIEPEMRLANLRDHWPVRRPDDLARWTRARSRPGLDRHEPHPGGKAACAAFCACSASRPIIAFCSFSNARTSIWRTRSRLMPYWTDRSSSVVGSSLRRRSVRMCFSRSLSTCMAAPRRPRRWSSSSSSASTVSCDALSSTSQSCHSVSLSERSMALSEWSGPSSRRFMSITSCSVTSSVVAICLTASGLRSPSSIACIWLFSRRRLKNSFFCAAVVPSFTSDQECRMYSWMAARIHHMA